MTVAFALSALRCMVASERRPNVRIPAFAAALLASCVSASEPLSLTGPWGGEMVSLEIGEGGSATIRESCGDIALDAIRPDVRGHFVTQGRLTNYAPGPQNADEAPASTPVEVTGRISGPTMTLIIAEPGAARRQIVLHKGRRAKVIRCY